MHTSKIELSKTAFKNNLNFIKQKIGGNTILSAVCKGNAYGHGIEPFVTIAESHGINHFSVFSSWEAEKVWRTSTKKSTIMIMGLIHNDEIPWAIENDIQFYIFEFDRLQMAIQAAKEIGKKAVIHIEIETGMNRTGFEEDQLPQLFEILKANQEYLQIEGLCTHYAGAESIANFLRIQQQISKYNELYKVFLDNGIKPTLRHTACSAAVINYPETKMDLVRMGIMLYGFWPNQETYIYQLSKSETPSHDPLKRLITWKTQVMSVKKVKMGEFIGYGTSYQAPANMLIATVPVGYSYGFTRSLSNLGRVLIRGKRLPVIGVVNMNLLMVGVNEIPDVQKGEEVVLIGKQRHHEITVASFGEMSSQLNYELLTRIPAEIPRVIKK